MLYVKIFYFFQQQHTISRISCSKWQVLRNTFRVPAEDSTSMPSLWLMCFFLECNPAGSMYLPKGFAHLKL